MTLENRIIRDLLDEKSTIYILDYLNIKLDNDLQQKYVKSLSRLDDRGEV
jgi:hypothetical protein